MRILMVFTSHDVLGNTGRKTGFWLEEGAAPYYVFKDAGVELVLASPKGGQPPIDPKSDLPENQTEAMARFKADPSAQKDFAHTKILSHMRSQDFDAVFYPGGHGPMWDLVDDQYSISLIESFYEGGKPVEATQIVVSTQHLDENLSSHDVKKLVEPYVTKALPAGWINGHTAWHVNPTGKFVIGGPDGDCDLTGRKIEDTKLVCNGAGAAGIAFLELLRSIGFRPENFS